MIQKHVQTKHICKNYVYFQKVLFVFELFLIHSFQYKNTLMKIDPRLQPRSPRAGSHKYWILSSVYLNILNISFWYAMVICSCFQ